MADEPSKTPQAQCAKEIYLSVYERAQESAHHIDVVLWEIAAIIWGGNTLLLGFILEAIDKPRALPLIVVSSVMALVLTAFVARIWYVSRVSKKIGYRTCQAIEKDYQFPKDLCLHTKIHEFYPEGVGTRWVYSISVLFAVAWLGVLFFALWLLLCRANTGGATSLS